jgi:SH3 domain protein
VKSIYLFILLNLFVFSSQAETRYITDQFEVTLRSGKSIKNEIIRMLPSGTRLEVLETDPASGYTFVKIPGGAQGWVLTRYTMSIPSARARLAAAESKLAKSEQKYKELEKKFNEISRLKTETVEERNRLNQQNLKVSRELAEIKRVSADALRISEENKRLKKRLATSDREIQFLQQENANLSDRSDRDWFMVGGGVVVFSMLFGIALTRIRWRRKSSWGDL